MTRFGKGFTAAVLTAVFAMHSGVAQAQCSATNPACAQTPTQTGSSGGGGGGVGVQVDVGDAAKAIGGLFKKKKKKPVEQPTEVATAPVEQPKQEIIYVRNPPVMQELPRTTTPRKTTSVAKPKPAPIVRKPVARKIAAPVAAAAVVAEPMFEPEAAAEIPVAEPVAEVVEPEAPVTKAATITPVEQPAAPTNNLYWMIAAAVAAVAATGTAAKFLLTPKVAMDCTIADGSSRMISDPSLTKPEVSFAVAIPGFSASTPDNFSIVA